MDPSVTQNDVIIEPCRTQPMSRHPALTVNANQNGSTTKYEPNHSRSDPGSFRISPPRVANPAHRNSAVQYIPMCPRDYTGAMLPESDYNGVFWRPF